MAPALKRLGVLTRLLYETAAVRSRPLNRLPMALWQFVHAGRPDESPLLKICCWMLLKVGSRSGVGPVRFESDSSHPTVPRARVIMTAYPSLLICIRLHLRVLNIAG